MYNISSFKRIIFLKFFFVSLFLFSQEKNLTTEYAKKIATGQIGLEGDKYDTLLFGQPPLDPDGDEDNDGLKNKEEIYIYTKNNREYIGYYSHPRLEDTDGDGLNDRLDSNKLVWDISSRDMAMFMELAYRNDSYVREVLNEDISNTEFTLYQGRDEYRMMHNELAPFWKVKKTYHKSGGFDAVLFEFDSPYPFLKNKEIQVLGIRGTSESNDIDDDLAIAAARVPRQLYDVMEIINHYASNRDVKNLYVTGHSLGGYLAQAAAAKSRLESYSWFKKAYTFNAPNLRANLLQRSWFKRLRDKSYEISNSGDSWHYAVDNDGVTNGTGRFAGYISVGRTERGHSSRSYFEEKISNNPNFRRGKRATMHESGYRDPQIDKLRFIELDKDKYNITTNIITKYIGVEATNEELKNAIKFIPKNRNTAPYTKRYEVRLRENYPTISLEDYPKDVILPVEVLYQDKGIENANITVHYILDTREIEPLKVAIEKELDLINNLDLKEKPNQALTDINNIKAEISEILNKIQILTTKTPAIEYNKYNQKNVNDFVTEVNSKIIEIKKLRKKIEITPVVNSITNKDTHITGFGVSGLSVTINKEGIQIGQVNVNNVSAFDLPLNDTLPVGTLIVVKTVINDFEFGVITSYPIEVIVKEKTDIDDGYYNGRIGINTDTPRATLDIREIPINELPKGTVQGVSFPKFTTEQRDRFQNVKPGTMIYNSTQKCIDLYVGDGVWNCLKSR